MGITGKRLNKKSSNFNQALKFLNEIWDVRVSFLNLLVDKLGQISAKFYTLFQVAFVLNILTVTTMLAYLFKKGLFLMKNYMFDFDQF